MKSRVRVALLMAAAALPLSASAASFQNGSFESPGQPGATWSALAGGSTLLGGWTVLGTGVDYIGMIWQQASGLASLDLDGSSPGGGVAQTFDTTPGSDYLVTFSMAGNPFSGDPVKQLRVSAAGSSSDYAFDTTGKSFASMGWEAKQFSFTATGTETTLSFLSLTPSSAACCWGPALDNVSVSVAVTPAVPEPGTYAMMLAGLGLLGVMARRRLSA